MEKWIVYKKHVDGKKEDVGIIELELGLSNASAWYRACLQFVEKPYYITGWSLHVKKA